MSWSSVYETNHRRDVMMMTTTTTTTMMMMMMMMMMTFHRTQSFKKQGVTSHEETV